MADPTPLASVVVPVKDDRRVHRLLDSLLGQTVPPGSYEIIVVENGSSCLAEAGAGAEGRIRYIHEDHAKLSLKK
jgi:hypothetical protein